MIRSLGTVDDHVTGHMTEFVVCCLGEDSGKLTLCWYVVQS